MTVREPTASDISALEMPSWELPEPEEGVLGNTLYMIQSVYYGVVARCVYFLRYIGWRQIANIVAALFAETLSALYAGYWFSQGKEKSFHYYGLNPVELSEEQKKHPAIILLHGKGSNQSVWVEVAKAFEKAGVPNVFTLNTSDGELTDADIPLLEEKYREIQALYGEQQAQFILIGHSRGAELSLYGALPSDTFTLQKGVCTQLKPWEGFRPEILRVIRLGSPLLESEKDKLPPHLREKIYEIDAMRDLIIPDRSLTPFYQADCGHLELVYDAAVHEKLIELIRS